MQNRYAGDMGDFGKIALLRAIQEEGLSIGVNWYLVDPIDLEKKSNGTYKQKDGKYLSGKFRECDVALSNTLTSIAKSDDRSVKALEHADLIPGARYFSEPVTVDGRTEWHHKALAALASVNVVFLDPDNGMLVDSVKPHYKKSVKYAFYDEVAAYIQQGQSVLIYNHRCRKPEEVYFREICEKLEYVTGISQEDMLKITFPRYTVRDFIAVPASPEHRKKIEAAMLSMTHGIWGDMGVCRMQE